MGHRLCGVGGRTDLAPVGGARDFSGEVLRCGRGMPVPGLVFRALEFDRTGASLLEMRKKHPGPDSVKRAGEAAKRIG